MTRARSLGCLLAAILACVSIPVPPNATAEALTVAPRAVAPRAADEAYAVVVHPATPIADVSLSQLRRIFRGEQQFWASGARVVLFVQSPGSSERAIVLRRLYEMNETEFRRFWIAKTFRDEVATGPKIVSSSALARRLTADIPGAIAIIPLSAVDPSVRVVRVDGRAPDAEGYALVGRP